MSYANALTPRTTSWVVASRGTEVVGVVAITCSLKKLESVPLVGPEIGDSLCCFTVFNWRCAAKVQPLKCSRRMGPCAILYDGCPRTVSHEVVPIGRIGRFRFLGYVHG